MTYIDANVFIFAASEEGEVGDAARTVVKSIIKGQREACTSVLTYDEVVWGVRKKLLDKEKGHWAGELFLSLPHLSLVDATREVITEAHHLMKHLNLKPRDAIHLATMHREKEREIISEDPDFDKIPGITRIPLLPRKV